jgi:hypothetical protein
MEVSIDTMRDAQNDQSSTAGGPNTQEGKEVVRWNATRHGISSPKPVVPGLEKQEDWESHRDGIMEYLSPVGHLEVTLAERVSLLSWRLHRVTRYETGAIATSQETIEDDIHDRDRFLSAIRHEGLESTHPVDIRFEAKHYKQAHSALRRFPSLGPDKTLKGTDASSVVWSVLMEAKKAAGRQIDVEVLDLPGVPEDAMIEELPAMKVADVRGCVEAIAAHASLNPDELLEAATYEAGCEARHAALMKGGGGAGNIQEGEGAHLTGRQDVRENKSLRSTPIQAALPRPARAREPPKIQNYRGGCATSKAGCARPSVD